MMFRRAWAEGTTTTTGRTMWPYAETCQALVHSIFIGRCTHCMQTQIDCSGGRKRDSAGCNAIEMHCHEPRSRTAASQARTCDTAPNPSPSFDLGCCCWTAVTMYHVETGDRQRPSRSAVNMHHVETAARQSPSCSAVTMHPVETATPTASLTQCCTACLC